MKNNNCSILLSFIILYQTIISSEAVKTKLTWVNGIGYNVDHMADAQRLFRDYFGGEKVEFCHNPTAMTTEEDYIGYIGDLTQAGAHKLGKITAEVSALVLHLKQALEEVGSSGRVIHIAHSQGALITALAAKQLSNDELNRIECIAFGGGTAIQKQQFAFRRVINYYALNDPLLYIVPAATKALRTGFISPTGAADHNNKKKNKYSSSEPEFIFLAPRSGDPVLDHGLFGPTYVEALSWEGRRYQQKYQPMTRKAVYTTGKLINHVLINSPLTLWLANLFSIIWSLLVFVFKDKLYQNILLPIAVFVSAWITALRLLIHQYRDHGHFEPVAVGMVNSS